MSERKYMPGDEIVDDTGGVWHPEGDVFKNGKFCAAAEDVIAYFEHGVKFARRFCHPKHNHGGSEGEPQIK
ncbi:MAG: hypothetical protein ACR2KS_10060 [Candidatus Eremiobacter antarcticus]|nr:hypothetical protein [Candidatus Eremiobacteraeota bacterium]